MREIIGFFDETGGFETYVGDILVVNCDVILPIFNSILTNHPLNNTKNTIHLDYCYYVFKDVLDSKRDVYDNNANFKFSQTNYINTKISKEGVYNFSLELVDFNCIYQYWNWILKAKKFSIIVEDNYKLQNEPFSYNEINKNFFEKNIYDAVNKFL